jgi:hypothetical protein
MGTLTTHRGTWSVDDLLATPWHYLPVEVPAGAAALRVTLSYPSSPPHPADSAAVLDLGCLGPDGFRGWSGGARSSFALAEAGATPGYLAGPVTAGLWQVVIGLHLVPPEGVPFTVTAEVIDASGGALGRALAEAGAVAPESGAALMSGGAGASGGALVTAALPDVPSSRPARRALPAPDGLVWLAGDLHAHSAHSDGVMSVAELAAHAVDRGLDFVAVTDHNTVSQHACLGPLSARYGVTLLPGQEVTTTLGHAGVLGDTGWIDFRSPAADWLTAAEAAGGLMSVNHPFGGAASWLHPMPRRPPLLEVWHWSWLDPAWTTPFSWWQAWDPGAVPVGGSDWHRPGSDAPLGTPTTWVLAANPSASGILAGLRAGRVAISGSRDGPVLLRDSGDLVAAEADGLVLAGPDGPYRRVAGDLVRMPGIPGYHRLLTLRGATVAFTP